MSKFNHWIRSKQGMTVIAAVVILALVFAVVGQFAGWWGGPGAAGGGGTITLTNPTYPTPAGGVTCMPTCEADDGRMLVIPGTDQSSFALEPTVLWIAVAGDQDSFTLSIFDGDSGKGTDNVVHPYAANPAWIDYRYGNWDDVLTGEATYTLYADPLADGAGKTVVSGFPLQGNAVMPNNAWYDITVPNAETARGPSRHFYYRIEATRPTGSMGSDTFKLKSSGYINAGYNAESGYNASFGLVAMLATGNDGTILYGPNFRSVFSPGGLPLKYDGNWTLQFYVPNATKTIDFWDGDFDRGTSSVITGVNPPGDTNDPNSPGIPAFAQSDPAVKAQRAAGQGIPPDNSPLPAYAVGDAVSYVVLNPNNQPLYSNDNPSGTEEWEKYVFTTDPGVQSPDALDTTEEMLPAGFYSIQIRGLDFHNYVWLRANYCVTTPDTRCGPPVWPESSCPRTIGYWKNNVKKVLIEGKTKGVQESEQTLDFALRNVALKSQIFRTGINVCSPAAITASNTRLTNAEADLILQRKDGYPCDNNSMLARALQQNLAAWMNLGSGKIGPNAWVVINVPSGVYEGTMLGALQEAESLILSGSNLERAKDIADMINNGQINADPEANLDGAGNPVCTIYDTAIPQTKQPPTHDKAPKAPKPEGPVPQPHPEYDPSTCSARSNTYNVENPATNPFDGIKFEYTSGAEVKEGAHDEFKVVMPADAVAGLASVAVEAKAGENVGQVALQGCSFTDSTACGDPVMDQNGFFGFQFLGAADNGDGTYTLTFWVYNYTSHGLSHATIGLPGGVVPAPYTSQVCP